MKTILADGFSDGAESVIGASQFKEKLKQGMGLNDDIIHMLENDLGYDEMVIEHLKKLGDSLADELAGATGVDAEDVKQTYERTLEEMARLSQTQGALEGKFDEALSKFLDVMPDSDSQVCY